MLFTEAPKEIFYMVLSQFSSIFLVIILLLEAHERSLKFFLFEELVILLVCVVVWVEAEYLLNFTEKATMKLKQCIAKQLQVSEADQRIWESFDEEQRTQQIIEEKQLFQQIIEEYQRNKAIKQFFDKQRQRTQQIIEEYQRIKVIKQSFDEEQRTQQIIEEKQQTPQIQEQDLDKVQPMQQNLEASSVSDVSADGDSDIEIIPDECDACPEQILPDHLRSLPMISITNSIQVTLVDHSESLPMKPSDENLDITTSTEKTLMDHSESLGIMPSDGISEDTTSEGSDELDISRSASSASSHVSSDWEVIMDYFYPAKHVDVN